MKNNISNVNDKIKSMFNTGMFNFRGYKIIEWYEKWRFIHWLHKELKIDSNEDG